MFKSFTLKSLLAVVLGLLICQPVYASDNIEIKIPQNCVDIHLPDTASYVLFLTSYKPTITDTQKRIKVASREDGRGLWAKKYYPGRFVGICDHGVFMQDAFDVKLLDLKNGNEITKFNHIPCYVDDANDIVIGVRGSNCDKLAGYRLSTGEKLWEKKIGKNYGLEWNVISRPDPSTIIFQSDYLGKIDIFSGEMTVYPLKNVTHDMKKSLGESALASGIGILGGLLTGFYAINVVMVYNVGFGSEAMMDENGLIYVYDADKIACLDSELKELWQTPLPNGAGSRGELHFRGDTIHMLNYGCIGAPETGIKKGKPFMASFNRATGECHKWDFLPEKWDEGEFGKTLNFVTGPVFVHDGSSDNNYSSLEIPSGCCLIKNTGNDVLIVDSDLNVFGKYDSGDVHLTMAELPDGYVIRTQSDTPSYIRITADGKVGGVYDSATTGIMLRNNRLVRKSGNMLTVTDLTD